MATNKTNQNDRPKETSEVKGRKLTLTKIEAVKDPISQKINQIRFVALEGVVTWKPKVVNEHFEDGLAVLETDKMDFVQVPQKMKEMLKIIQAKSKVAVTANFKIMKTTTEKNEPVEYMFITSEKEFDTWAIAKGGN